MNIIFDLGGVLVDWNPEAIVQTVFDDAETGARVKQAVFQHPDWLEMDRGVLTEAEAIPRFARRTGLAESVIADLLAAADRLLLARPDSVELLRELHGKGLALYCLSNIPSERFASLRRRYDFFEAFSGVVISGQVRLVKPQREIYEHLLNAYGLHPSSCIFLDDSPKNVEGARAVGIHGIVFTDAASCRAALARLLA
jgi:putative hydrolase of the HAD superfamily